MTEQRDNRGLPLSIKAGDKILIGDNITLNFYKKAYRGTGNVFGAGKLKVRIHAPLEVKIIRVKNNIDKLAMELGGRA